MSRARLRLGFAGTPEFACASLRALLDARADEVVVVYTQPDRPSGRGRHCQPTPVKALALEHGLTVRQPARLRGEETAIRDFVALGLDLLVVVAYGLLLPSAVIEAPRLGSINVHASLLPRWRGAAPIERAIQAGDRDTGVSIMQVTEPLDAGPVWLQRTTPIGPQETAGALRARLADLGARALLEAIELISSGRAGPEPQDEAAVTYAAKLSREEAQLDWRRPAVDLERAVRAFQPRPGAWASLHGEELRIHRAEVLAGDPGLAPGSPLALGSDGLAITTGDGLLRLLEVQRPGRQRMAIAEYLRGRPGGAAPPGARTA